MKWISSYSANGRKRSFDRITTFALNNAVAECLPFTALDCFRIKGKNITHNYK